MPSLAALALALDDVEEGVSCAGTALESRTFLVRKKAFLFLSSKTLRLKLGPSIADAQRRGYEVGTGGWVKMDVAALPAQSLLKSWIAESYSLFAGAKGAVAKGAVAKGAVAKGAVAKSAAKKSASARRAKR